MDREITGGVEVEAPIGKVYDYWRNLENLPSFMKDIEEVRSTGPDTTHWVVKGPLGYRVEFDAKTTRDEPNSAIGWTALEEDDGDSGLVRFLEVAPNRTRVEVRLGRVGGDGRRSGPKPGPEAIMERDLRNFKDIIEGKASPRRAEVRDRPASTNLGAMRLLDGWEAEDSGYDEAALSELKEALDRDRPGQRKLFER